MMDYCRTKTKELERCIAEFCRTKKQVCLNSVTVAEKLDLKILRVKPRDEVIVPAYTYTASASVANHCDATAIFVKAYEEQTGEEKGDSTYKNYKEQKNPMVGKKVIFEDNEDEQENSDGVRGHLDVVDDSDY